MIHLWRSACTYLTGTFRKVSWRGTAPHRTAFLGSVNEGEPNFAVLGLKNLHLGPSSLVFCPVSNFSKLERCEDIQLSLWKLDETSANNGRVVRLCRVRSCLPPSWITASEIVSRIAAHAVASFAVSSEKSWRATANARKSSRKKYHQSTRTRY